MTASTSSSRGQVLHPATGLLVSSLTCVLCILFAWNTLAEMIWPVTQGVVQRVSFGTRKYNYSRSPVTLHCLYLAYTYEVSGKKFSDLKELDAQSSEADVLLKAHDFEPGDSVPVHYNPANPSQSYLNHLYEEAPLPVLFTFFGFSALYASFEICTLTLGWLRGLLAR